ncbi:MAG TPA: 2-dehydropantoate 2-reductase N-terminal domain-containing protein, partial [Thermomicrobiales bacterium]|nr:2-dehydropantoate 2-reductase N-terminal domain-containing protein [Thermomicrobiales bacterium]
MKITIVGAGAMGGLWASRLAATGHDVAVLDVAQPIVEAIERPRPCDAVSVGERDQMKPGVVEPGRVGDRSPVDDRTAQLEPVAVVHHHIFCRTHDRRERRQLDDASLVQRALVEIDVVGDLHEHGSPVSCVRAKRGGHLAVGWSGSRDAAQQATDEPRGAGEVVCAVADRGAEMDQPHAPAQQPDGNRAHPKGDGEVARRGRLRPGRGRLADSGCGRVVVPADPHGSFAGEYGAVTRPHGAERAAASRVRGRDEIARQRRRGCWRLVEQSLVCEAGDRRL